LGERCRPGRARWRRRGTRRLGLRERRELRLRFVRLPTVGIGRRRSVRSRRRSGRPRPNPRLSNPPKHLHGEQVAAGWPSWLSAVAGEAINGWTPRRADTFEKLDKVSDLLLLNVRYSVESRFEEIIY